MLEKLRTASSVEGDRGAGNTDTITPTLAEACIHAARHSNELLTQVWVEGTLATFGYFDAQYLFSSAVVLAISGVLDGRSNDRERMDSASQLLHYLANSGNLSATEFCGHLDQVRTACDNYRSEEVDHVADYPPDGSLVYSGGANLLAQEITTEMALGQSPMQDFLTRSEFTFDIPATGFLDDSIFFQNWPSEL